MSDTPTTDRLEITEDGGKGIRLRMGLVDAPQMRKMERLLRHLRANVNCYVPPPVLQEIDDFLNQK